MKKKWMVIHAECDVLLVPLTCSISVKDIRLIFSNVKYPLWKGDGIGNMIPYVATALVE